MCIIYSFLCNLETLVSHTKMLSQRSIAGFLNRVGLLNQPSHILLGSRFSRSESLLSHVNTPSVFSHNYSVFPGSWLLKDQPPMLAGSAPKLLGSLGRKLDFLNVVDKVSPPNALYFRSGIHSSCPKEFDMNMDRGPMNFSRRVLEGNRNNAMMGPQFAHQEVEKDFADIVHIKLIRNNAFVTVTDSKGNKKIGASSGCLSGKVSRYSAESTAEHVGRLARNMGLKSFVVKVNGFTHFKKKKQAILSFRDGYTNSRNDQNPVVYIEDTTRRAHNGCRLRKQRRV